MPGDITPIDGDEDDDRTYIRNKRKAPPWVVVHRVGPDEDIPFDIDPSETELYYYHEGAGPKLVTAVQDQHPEFDGEALFQANKHVIEKSGDAIREGVRDGEIDAEPIMAAQDVIAKFAAVSAEDGAYPESEHVDALVAGWNDGGHEALEREYFKHDASKLSVACALHRLRNELMEARPE